MTNKTWIFCGFFMLSVFCAGSTVPVKAQEVKDAFRATPYPIPRFVSINADEVYVRSGPGTKYPIKFLYKKKGLPVEVILEYETWRKVRDHDGDEGWVHQSLISGKRTGLLESKELVPFYSTPKDGARLVARAEPGALGRIDECKVDYCRFELSGYKGWVKKDSIWGVYKDEVFE